MNLNIFFFGFCKSFGLDYFFRCSFMSKLWSYRTEGMEILNLHQYLPFHSTASSQKTISTYCHFVSLASSSGSSSGGNFNSCNSFVQTIFYLYSTRILCPNYHVLLAHYRTWWFVQLIPCLQFAVLTRNFKFCIQILRTHTHNKHIKYRVT